MYSYTVGGDGDVTGSNYSDFMLTSATNNAITAPRIATNITTKYECKINLVNSASSKTHVDWRDHTTLTVSKMPFTTTWDPVACTQGRIGTVYKFTFTLPLANHDVPASSNDKNYYMEFGFLSTGAGSYAAKLGGSGLAIGDDFPIVCEGTGMGTGNTATVGNDGTQDSVKMKIVTTPITSTTTGSCYWPLGVLASAGKGVIALANAYYVLAADPRDKQILQGKATN